MCNKKFLGIVPRNFSLHFSISPTVFYDPQKRDKVNLDYIEYFKNIERLVVIKENKNGSLQLGKKE